MFGEFNFCSHLLAHTKSRQILSVFSKKTRHALIKKSVKIACMGIGDLEESRILMSCFKVLEMDVVSSEIQRFTQKHEERLHHHENVKAIQLLDNMGIVRRLQRKKPFELV